VRRVHHRRLLQVLAVGWLARAAFILLSSPRARSTDVFSWIAVAHELRAGANPYETTTFLNWPPLWLVVIWILDHVSSALGISFFLTLRLFLILVESGVVVLLYSFLARVAPDQARRIVIVGISLNPIAILLVCQHGNFDVLVGLTCLAGALAIARYSRTRDAIMWLVGALALGLGALAKTVPLLLAPLLARGARLNGWPARWIALALFVGPALLGDAVILVLAPHAVVHNVLFYRSQPGSYGITGIARAIGVGAIGDGYSRVLFPLVLLAFEVAAVVMLSRRDLDTRRTLLLAALILFAIPAIGSGYAPQYAYWWLPLLVATYPLFDRGWRLLLLAFYIIAAATYIVEYGLLIDHGAFLIVNDHFKPGVFLNDAKLRFSHPTWLTVLRLPLFLASLAVIAGGVVRLLRARDPVSPR
jgi:hypothetical protein